MSRRSSTNPKEKADKGKKQGKVVDDREHIIETITTYSDAMGENDPPAEALGARLVAFRNWLTGDAGCLLHPSTCIVNGEATDGTKNAPVLTLTGYTHSHPPPGRCGGIDRSDDRALYEKTMGCQVFAARELKKGEILCVIPRSAMVTPDTVACSDAGRAVRSCIDHSPTGINDNGNGNGNGNGNDGNDNGNDPFWSAFRHTGEWIRSATDSVHVSATRLLVNILAERKRAEGAYQKALTNSTKNGNATVGANNTTSQVPSGTVSTRAAVMAFLIHQRFHPSRAPAVSASRSDDDNDTNFTAGTGPPSFAPYARTLPPSISLPIGWKRNELALLSACVSGLQTLQEVAAHTSALASDYCALLDAGLLWKFPEVFPDNMITWDRWVWAASVHMSRSFPSSMYHSCPPDQPPAQNSPRDACATSYDPDGSGVWGDLGVMVPLLDMLNHEHEASQIQWEPASESTPHPRIAMAKRAKKASQVYNSYGMSSNQDFLSQYGFALMGNSSDTVTLGFSLVDAVGRIGCVPNDYDEQQIMASLLSSSSSLSSSKKAKDVTLPLHLHPDFLIPSDTDYLVFDSTLTSKVGLWWNVNRLRLLESLPNFSNQVTKTLQMGKKLSCLAHCDGTYDNTLVAIAVVSTAPRAEVSRLMTVQAHEGDATDGGDDQEHPVKTGGLSKRHVRILRRYLIYFFSRKLEKLLQNLDTGLKDHFHYNKIWHRLTEGGLCYPLSQSGDKKDDAQLSHGVSSHCQGWHSFFDTYAYNATMEIEKRYYAMAPESCVLTLYDGHLRAIQSSIEGLLIQEKFESGILQQIQDIGFVLSDDEGIDEDFRVSIPTKTVMSKCGNERNEGISNGTRNYDDQDKKHIESANSDCLQNLKGQPTLSIEDKAASGAGKRASSDHDDKSDTKSYSTRGRMSQKANDVSSRQRLSKSYQDSHPKHTDGRNAGNNHQHPNFSRKNNNSNHKIHNQHINNNHNDLRSRPPAIKLHIGNLSYNTVPANLFDFFASQYGRENVLECHIPIERETNKSRGFGFVTMPEDSAMRALSAGRVHEIEGRVLKVALSNTAGSARNHRNKDNPPPPTGDRCSKCGYRPRYCDCARTQQPPPNFGNWWGWNGRAAAPPPERRRSPSCDSWSRSRSRSYGRRDERKSRSIHSSIGGRHGQGQGHHGHKGDDSSERKRGSNHRSRSRSRSRGRVKERGRRRRSRGSSSSGRRESSSKRYNHHRHYSRSRSRSRNRSSWPSRSRSRSWSEG